MVTYWMPAPLKTKVLAALFTANQWARQLPFYIVDFQAAATEATARQFMNVDLSFDAAQYGVLASVGFGALFSATSLVAGGLGRASGIR